MSNKIIDRVRKLLALAEGSSGHEAETAAAMARRLMREHAVSMESVEASDRPTDPLVKVHVVFRGLTLSRDLTSSRPARTAWWKRELASAVGRYLDLRNAYSKGSSSWFFYGYQSDVEVALYLYDVCARQIDVACRAYLREKKECHSYYWDRGMSRTASTEFRQSAVEGLRTKFHDLKKTEKTEDPGGFALMLNRKSAVNQWVADNFSFGSSKNWGGSAGYSSAGYTAGRNVRLNAGVSGGNSNRGSLKAVKGYLA